jgi:Ca2+-binding EF-hand superfamily protein
MEMDETRRLFEWINRDDTGYLSHAELRVLLVILGLKTNTRGLDDYLHAIDPKREGHVNFEKFWGWWSNSRQE